MRASHGIAPGSEFVVFVGAVAAVGEDEQAEHKQREQQPGQARARANQYQSMAGDGKQNLVLEGTRDFSPWVLIDRSRSRLAAYANACFTTRPATSVRRSSRLLWRVVSFS